MKQFPIYLVCATIVPMGIPHYKTLSDDEVVVYGLEPGHSPHGDDQMPEWPSRPRGPTAFTTSASADFAWSKVL